MADAHDPSPSASRNYASSGSTSHEAADFECNICFDLAQDPVITLCGHLYCWPCLYKWLRVHSQSQECPVCKALVKEETVIPLYGRGKTGNDPRSKPIPGVEIPNRPAGHRPETASPPADHNFSNLVFGLIGGFIPIASASLGNIGISAGFGGLLSPFFVQFQGFPYTGVSSAASQGYPYNGSSRNRESARGREARQGAEEDDENLKKILLTILFFVFIVFLTM